jgi:hypothetical protein
MLHGEERALRVPADTGNFKPAESLQFQNVDGNISTDPGRSTATRFHIGWAQALCCRQSVSRGDNLGRIPLGSTEHEQRIENFSIPIYPNVLLY